MAKKIREDKIKSLRILQIDEQIRSGTYPNVPKLQKMFEVSRATIMRDIEFLRDLYEAPLEYASQRNGYYYTDPTFFIKSLMLSEGELFTVTTVLPLLEQYKNTPLESSFKNIISKMMTMLPDSVQVDSSFNTQNVTFIKDPLPQIKEEIFNTIFTAIKNKSTVEFGYRSISKTEYSKRQFDPYNVLCQKGNWYVIGFCHKHKDFFTYALSRMDTLVTTGEHFEKRPDFNLNNHIDPDFGVWNNNTPAQKIELEFSSSINTYILERTWHVAQECHQNPDGSVYLSFMSNQLQETLHWVLHFGSAVKVINPPELRQKVIEEAQKILKGY